MFARDYRARARENLSGSWPLSIGVALIAHMLGGLLCGNSFLPEININIEGQTISSLADLLPVIFSAGGIAVGFGSALNLLHFILGGVIQMGHAKFLLKQHDRRDPQFNDLFSMFDWFGTGFCQAFLRGMYTFFWSLLFIFPGIIAAYRYAMTPYILAEHPDMTASEAISASKELMYGHKWELFCLHFSFIGWCLLCTLTGGLGYIVLNPYMSAAEAAFYRNIRRQQ